MYDVGNPGHGLGQAHKCGRVKQVNKVNKKNKMLDRYTAVLEFQHLCPKL